MGVITAICVVVANMVGTGIFTSTGFMAANLPSSKWILLCWIAGGTIALAGAICYAELATRIPEAGGEYTYLARLFHPCIGFLSGWTSLIAGFSAPIAVTAISFSYYFLACNPESRNELGPTTYMWLVRGIAVMLIALFSSIHTLGARISIGTQNVMTAMKVLLIAGLSGVGWYKAGNVNMASLPATISGNGSFAVGTSILLVSFAYSGWNASTYIAGELKDPRRTLPISLLLGTGIVICLYLAMNLFILRAVRFPDLVGSPIAAEMAVANAFGRGAGRMLNGLIGFALLSSLSAYIMIGPRVYYAMARDGLFFDFANRLHSRNGVPSHSIVFQGIIAIGMTIAGGLEQLLIYLGFALSIFPILAVTGLHIARKRRTGEKKAVRVPGYPFVPALFLAANLLLLGVTFYNRPLESCVALATVLLGIPAYFLWNRRPSNYRDMDSDLQSFTG
jgi:APA family basic amino acid/polyamine antiporter